MSEEAARTKREAFLMAREATADPRIFAYLTERTKASGGGMLCICLLIGINIAMPLLFFGSTNSAVQQAAIGCVWIALNQVFGVGALLGRRRTFVMRKPEEEPRHEPLP